MKRPNQIRAALRGTVLRYDDPSEPVGMEDWEVLRATSRWELDPPSHPAAPADDAEPSP